MADVYPPMMAAAREWLKTRCGVDDFFRELTLMAFVEPDQNLRLHWNASKCVKMVMFLLASKQFALPGVGHEVNLTRFVAYLLEGELLRVGAEPRDRGGDLPRSSSSSL